MRMIDADALHKELMAKQKWVVTYEDKHNEGYTSDQVHFAIDKQPTIDAVEVVRCGECKYFGEYCDEYKEETQNDGMCELDIKDSVTFDWFCADGERREK